jgi:flavodoxin
MRGLFYQGRRRVESLKGVVAYDSIHGSTKKAAEAIAEQIKADGHQVDLLLVKERKGDEVQGDFMFIGSPTRGGSMTKDMKEFIENLNKEKWRNRAIVAFDTLGPLSKNLEKRKSMLMNLKEDAKTAATSIRRLCRERGLSVHGKVLHLAVTGMWGPLAPDGPEMAKEFTHEFLNSYGK